MLVDKIPRWKTPERRAYMEAWHAANPRDRRTYKAAYDAAHRRENAAYRAANAEKLRAKHAAYYKANRERIIAYVKSRDAANPNRVSAYHAEHYARNSERIKSNVAAYRKANPGKKGALESRRRARKHGNGGSHTSEQFASLGNVCHYCGKVGSMTRDHVIPITRFGTDNIENIVPACRSCNSKKNAKTAEEYLAILESRRV